MATITYHAPAKINLSLDILRKRRDGYHDLKMVLQSISLWDIVTLETGTGTGITVKTDLPYLPCDDRNIAARAAKIFFEETGLPSDGLAITIEKHIPVCAGLGGGSTDGAAVLKGLRELYVPLLPREILEDIASKVGSDVPYCVRGGTVLAEGRGERMTTQPSLPPCFAVICKPEFSISTPELFGQVVVSKLPCHPDTRGLLRAIALGDLDGAAHRMYNVFEDVLPPKYREVFEIKSKLLDFGAQGAVMTGSGSAVFGLFREETAAQQAYAALSDSYPQTFLAKTL
ncbi:MAG: 4-(cytidine 5'-diphospho)-2-C-methyl-D-erythritol kinase [Oscillospiraceae bacterium]